MQGGNLSEADASRRIREFEIKHQLLEAEIDGVKPWQLIRFEAALALQRLNISRQAVSRARLLISLPRALIQWMNLPGKISYVCKTFDSSLRVKSASGYQDIYFDWLIRNLHGGVKISSCDAAGYESKLRNSSLRPSFDDTSIIATSALLAKFLPQYRHHEIFERIAGLLKSAPDMPEISSQRISTVFNTFLWRERLYRKLLSKIEAETILVADGGQFALLAACRRLSIRYIELQHGIATKIHPNILPRDLTRAERANLLLPDLFAVFGQQAKDALAGSILDFEGNVVPVGSGYMDELRSERLRTTIAEEGLIVTLTTQGVATEQLVSFTSDLLTQCDRNLRLNIKLHPAYYADRQRFSEAFANDERVAIWDVNSDVSAQELIANSDLHMSISSTCHYDALGLGTPTAVLPLETFETVQGLHGVDGVVFACSAEQLANLIRSRSFPVVPPSTMNYFFSEGFITNIRNCVRASD